MPNGGSDCCGTCWFNQSLEGQRGSGNFNREIPSHCEIRDLDIIDGSRPAHAPPAKRSSYVSFDVRQYRRAIPGIASCGRTAPAAASNSSRHVSPIHGCGRGPDCIGCVERGVGVLGCSAISAWRSSSPTPRHLRGGGDGEPTAELAMPAVDHVLGDSAHAGVDNPPRTGYGRLQMTTSQTARSDPAAPFGAR